MASSDPRENHRRFQDCWNAGDIDGLIALYEPEAVYVGGADEQLVGHEAIRKLLEQAVGSGIQNHLELVRLTEHGDIALERTRWTMRMPGQDEPAMEGDSNVVLHRGADGRWRMIVDDPGL